MKKVWSSLAVLALTATGVAYAADTGTGTNYAPPVESHTAQPDKAARKAARAANHKLERAVRKAIEMDGGVDVARINVTAKSGKVTLTGQVPEEGQIDTAVERAKSVPGVTDVNNKLTIGEPGH